MTRRGGGRGKRLRQDARRRNENSFLRSMGYVFHEGRAAWLHPRLERFLTREEALESARRDASP